MIKQTGTFQTNLASGLSRWAGEIGEKVVCYNEDIFHLIVGEIIETLPHGAEFIDRKWDDECYVVKDIGTGKKSHWRPARVTPYEAAPFWRGSKPTVCDMCRCKFSGNIMIDGRTYTGQWGLLCESCHRLQGFGLGTGNGQKYLLHEESQRWFKIEG